MAATLSIASSFFSLSSRPLCVSSARSYPHKHRTSSSSPSLFSSSLSSSKMDFPNQSQGKRFSFMDFPYISSNQKDLMVNLVSTLETRLCSFLLPSDIPEDIKYLQNSSGTSRAAFHVRSGIKSSPIDLIFGSWIHCDLLASSSSLNITTISAYLSPLTDAPNFLFELIQSSPTSALLCLDLYPRRDLVLHPDYLTTFYENTGLDDHRQLLATLPEVKPYISPSLFVRSMFSPSAILVHIVTDGEERLQEIVDHHVSPIAKEMLGIWIDVCALESRELGESERDGIIKRDEMIKKKSIETDLESNFPKLFGEEITAKAIGNIKEFFHL